MNTNLVHPSKRPGCRDTIYDGFDSGNFETYVKTKLAFKINPKPKSKDDSSRSKETSEKLH